MTTDSPPHLRKPRKGEVSLLHNYEPTKQQRAFHNSDAKARLLAGAFGSGKTKAAAREAFKLALTHPGSLGIVARYEYRPLLDSTWRTFKRELDEVGLRDPMVKVSGGTSGANPPRIKFAEELGGSEIIFRNAKDENQLLGLEIDWAFIDEGAEVPDSIYEIIGARLRGNPVDPDRPGLKTINEDGIAVAGPLKFWVATNPGPSTFIRERFRPPGVEGKPLEGFESFHIPTLKADGTKAHKYIQDSTVNWLKTQFSGARLAAFAYGDWSSFEGQVFTMFDREKHVCDDIEMADLSNKIVVEGWDFGRAVETAVVWIAFDEKGENPITVFHDYGKAETEVGDHARHVKWVRKHYGLTEDNLIVVGDPAGGQRQAAGSYFEEYARHGIYITPMQAGKQTHIRDERLAQYLGADINYPDGSTRPAIQFCRRTLPGLVNESMLLMKYVQDKNLTDKDRPDARAKKDDHKTDALQYGLMATPLPAERQPLQRFRPGVVVSPTPATAHLFDGRDSLPDDGQ